MLQQLTDAFEGQKSAIRSSISSYPTVRSLGLCGTGMGWSPMDGNGSSQNERWIDVRKLAALDIVLHGPRVIIAEFALSVLLGVAGGVFSLHAFLRDPTHPLAPLLWASIFSWIALNYMPLLLYAVDIVKRKSAQQEVAFELEHKDVYVRKYTRQSLLLILPLIIPVLAIVQEFRKR